MSNVYETGHGKNVANLLKFNQLLATFGGTYNPANPALTAGAFTTLYNTANTNLLNATTTWNTWKNATNNREIAFLPLDKLSTKLLGALESTSAPQQTIDDFNFLVRKIRGDAKHVKEDVENQIQALPAIPNPNPIPEQDLSKSNSQRSFDNLLQHFQKMILLLQSVPSYSPNEVAYQVPTLQAQLTNLINLNNLANVSYANLKAARIARNLTFYAKDTGMLDRVKKSKAYIKSIFGSGSQQYLAATAIKFFRVISRIKAF